MKCVSLLNLTRGAPRVLFILWCVLTSQEETSLRCRAVLRGRLDCTKRSFLTTDTHSQCSCSAYRAAVLGALCGCLKRFQNSSKYGPNRLLTGSGGMASWPAGRGYRANSSKVLRNFNERQTANIRARKPALPRCGAVGLDQTLAFVMPDRRDSQAVTLCQIAGCLFFHASAIICLTSS